MFSVKANIYTDSLTTEVHVGGRKFDHALKVADIWTGLGLRVSACICVSLYVCLCLCV